MTTLPLRSALAGSRAGAGALSRNGCVGTGPVVAIVVPWLAASAGMQMSMALPKGLVAAVPRGSPGVLIVAGLLPATRRLLDRPRPGER